MSLPKISTTQFETAIASSLDLTFTCHANSQIYLLRKFTLHGNFHPTQIYLSRKFISHANLPSTPIYLPRKLPSTPKIVLKYRIQGKV